MKKIVSRGLIFILALSFQAFTPRAFAADSPRAELEERRRAVAETMEAATVWIVAEDSKRYRIGSGFIVGEGFILTNAHVIEGLGKDMAVFVLNEKISARKARVVDMVYENKGGASGTDLALLRFDPPKGAKLPVLSFNVDVKRTDRVSAWGYPDMAIKFDASTDRLSKGNKSNLQPPPVIYTEGTVNAIVRGKRGNSILHSAAIASGNSGGPLVNGRGEVVGINTWGHQEEGEGAFLNGAQPASEIVSFLADNGLTPRLAAGPQTTTPQARSEAPSSSGSRGQAAKEAKVTLGNYTLTVPHGWSVGAQDDDSIVAAADDDSAGVGIFLGDLEGQSLSQVARTLSRGHGGTTPKLDDGAYVFNFTDDDGDKALAVVGETDRESQFFVVYVFGDFDNPGISEFLKSVR